MNIINSTISPNQSIQLPLWFSVSTLFVSSLYSKEESLGAEVGLSGNILTFYPLGILTELTGQLVVLLD